MDITTMLKYNALLRIRNAALAGNEDPFIWAYVPARFREAIKHMSDADIKHLLQAHPDLITLEYTDEALITQVLDMIEKNATTEEIQSMVDTWLKARSHKS